MKKLNIIIECNKAALTLLSKERKDIIGKNLFDLPFLSNLIKISDYIKLDVNLSHIFKHIIKNKCYEIKLSPYISNDEKFKILSIEDITEKLIAERKLHQENKLITIGQISAGLAHEIRNPLKLL